MHLYTKRLSDMFHVHDLGRGAKIAPLPNGGYLLAKFCDMASRISCTGTSSSLWSQSVVAMMR